MRHPHVSPIPKGYNSLHSPLTSAYDHTNYSQFAPPYRRTHDYGAVQPNALFHESPDTQSLIAVALPLASENINLPCVRTNPNDRLTRVHEPSGEKLRGDRL